MAAAFASVSHEPHGPGRRGPGTRTSSSTGVRANSPSRLRDRTTNETWRGRVRRRRSGGTGRARDPFGVRLKVRVGRHHPVVVASFDKVLPIHRCPSGRGTHGRSNGRGCNGRPGQAEDQCRGGAKDQSAARNPSERYGTHVTPKPESGHASRIG